MSIQSQIQYLPHKNIDKTAWDDCIRKSAKSLIYNFSWYLDIMSPNWDALILNNYEAVMPLTWNKKFGIDYLYQPFFTAQLGITSGKNDSTITDAFLQAIPAKFKLIDIDLHENNNNTAFADASHKRVNMLLDITGEYNDVYKQYHRLAERMIKKAAAEKIKVDMNADIAESIAFYQQQYNAQVKIKTAVYEKLIEMFRVASLKNHIFSLSAKKDGRLLGMYVLLKDENYVYSVIGGSSAEGKQQGVFYLLTDCAIKNSCNANRQFRFEGSDLPGIANFNQQFGAKPFYYNHIKINRLPFFLKPFKK